MATNSDDTGRRASSISESRNSYIIGARKHAMSEGTMGMSGRGMSSRYQSRLSVDGARPDTEDSQICNFFV